MSIFTSPYILGKVPSFRFILDKTAANPSSHDKLTG